MVLGEGNTCTSDPMHSILPLGKAKTNRSYIVNSDSNRSQKKKKKKKKKEEKRKRKPNPKKTHTPTTPTT